MSYVNPICILPVAVFAVLAIPVILDMMLDFMEFIFEKGDIKIMSKNKWIWFAWYPVETNKGWVWLKKVEWQYDDMGFGSTDHIYTKIEEK